MVIVTLSIYQKEIKIINTLFLQDQQIAQ